MTIPAAPQCDPRFRPLLADFEAGVLENANATVYGLWPDLTLAFLNPAWFQFAAENRGEPAISKDWPLGRCILDAIPASIRPFFEVNYRRSLQEGRPWVHVYECSSEAVYRNFHLKVFPLENSEGLLLVNSLWVETAQQQETFPPIEERYRNRNGLIIQCCHCRRFRRADAHSTWDWVRPWVEKMPENISHGICKICTGFYYAERKFDDDPPEAFSTI
jgi:hypothetical protein